MPISFIAIKAWETQFFLLEPILYISTLVSLKATKEPPLWIFNVIFIFYDSQMNKPHNSEKSKQKASSVSKWEQKEI